MGQNCDSQSYLWGEFTVDQNDSGQLTVLNIKVFWLMNKKGFH